MTENTTTEDTTTRLVPKGSDPLDDLTAGELGHVGRLLKCDVYEAVHGTDDPKSPAIGQRWPALAHLAWVWRRRTDPHAKLDAHLQLKPAELSELLGLNDEADEQPEDDAETNPTDSTPASS